MITSPTLVRPKAGKLSEGRRGMGRYEHENRYQVLGTDAADEEIAADYWWGVAEPFVDTDVEVSDPECEDDSDDKDDGMPEVQGPEPGGAEEDREAPGGAQRRVEKPRARLIRRPLPMSRAQRDLHIAEGHVNYHPGCEFCARTRGRPEAHRRKDQDEEVLDEDEGEASEDEIPKDVPTVSFDFCFLAQLQQEKSNTVLVAKDGRRKAMMATVCPSKSTVDAMHSTGVCKRLATFLDFLGYPCMALRSDQDKSTWRCKKGLRP